mmetsp:Transcript_15811/g.44241  ORF Transcript_15811/g.44241 Transcript_15811/m.44241 type:complete len:304 (-) Transcript_15811:328-1239(-)
MGRYGNAVRAAVLLTVLLQWASGRVSPALTATGQRKLTGAQENCDLCADNWLLVLAAGGRTGSTSVQSMFSSVPGFEIMGEHGGFLRQHMATVEAIRLARDLWLSDDNSWKPAWKHSDVDMHSVYCSVQDLVRRVLFGSRYGEASPKVMGFKEIRYTNAEMMAFLGTVFPCARIVFPLREQHLNPEVKEEEWVKYVPLEEKAEFVKMIHGKFNGTTTALLPLETRSVEDFNRILHDMVGVRGCRFNRSIHDNAEGGYHADQAGDVVQGQCDLSQVDFRLDEATLQRHATLWAEVQQSGPRKAP